MGGIVPTAAQIERLAGEGPEGPIVMVNLLKYRALAAYPPDRPEAKERLSGEAAYRRYGTTALKHVMALGGRIVWAGAQKHVVIGDETADDWDEIVCVNYPSRADFLSMIQDPDYLAAHYHRDAGLERTALLCCSAGIAA